MTGDVQNNHLESFSWWTFFDQKSRTVLKENVYCRSYKKGQVLFDEEDLRDRIFVLKKGMIRIEKEDPSASYQFIDFVTDDQMFPLCDMFSSKKYSYSAVAITDIQVFYLSASVFEGLIRTNYDYLEYFNCLTQKTLSKQMKRIQYCITSSAKERVKNSLALLMQEFGKKNEEGVFIPYPFLINDLAKFSGTTRETVSHTIKELTEKNKLVYRYKEFTFYDEHYFLLEDHD